MLQLSEAIGPGLARAALAGKIDHCPCDLVTPLEKDSEVALFTYRDEEGAHIFRHTAAHVMAAAIKRLYPDAVLEDGPATESGFFYDILMTEPVGPEAFPEIGSVASAVDCWNWFDQRRVADDSGSMEYASTTPPLPGPVDGLLTKALPLWTHGFPMMPAPWAPARATFQSSPPVAFKNIMLRGNDGLVVLPIKMM